MLMSSKNHFAQCNSVTLNSQFEVNNFGINNSGCTQISGNLLINGVDITDLTPLSNLTSVSGNVQLWGNSTLTSLQGLHNITNIGGILDLEGFNFPLMNLNGLSSLQTVGGMVSIQSFPSLVSVQGLSNLVSVGGNFLIQNNTNSDFTSISLSNLESVGIFNIRNNNNLTTIEFSSLESVGGDFHLVGNSTLIIADFPALEVVGVNLVSEFQINNGVFEIFQCSSLINPNFSSLTTIKGGLDIIQNNSLQSLGFQNVTSVLRNIRINGNPVLATINGLELTGNVTSFSLIGSNVVNLNTLSGVTSIGLGVTGDLLIKDNPLLNDISGLTGIESINKNLEISNNDSLLNLNGLNALSTINYGYLSIMDNALLTQVDGLGNLTSVGLMGNVQGVLIVNNSALTNLNGLASMATLKGSLTIRNNPALVDISALNITNYPIAASGGFYLENNDSLLNLTGMFMQSINGQVQVLGNDLLQAIDFTIANPSVVTSLLIDNNLALQNLSGLSAITEINGSFGGFRVINNDSLQNLDGLNFTNINGNYLFIKDNQALTNIDGLESLINVSNNVSLEIINNAQLATLNGLKHLVKVGKILIQSNPLLVNIDGLSSITQLTLTSDTKLLSIYNNTILESIQGIRNINQATIFNLVVFFNPNVAVCDLKNVCEYLATAKPRTISNNQSGCNSIAEVVNSCPTIWNGTSWSDGLPNATRSALIEGDLDLTTTLSAKNFTVNSGVFKILSEASLFVNGSVINNTFPENFVVQNKANLVQTALSSNRKNQGKVKILTQNPPYKRLDYTMWSSPIENQNLFDFSPLTVNGVTNYIGSPGRIYIYDGANGYINPTPFGQNTLFTNGRGYLFRAPNNWSTTVPVAYEGQFIGVPNNGNQIVTTALNSFTSIGNPYASTIDALELFEANPNLGALYFWTNTNPAENGDYTQNNYASYTAVGGVAANGGEVEPTNHIAVGQGFIAYNGSTQVTFDNNMRIGSSTNFFKSATVEKHRFWLNLHDENNVNYNQILISYMTGATNGFDTQIDGKLFGYNGSSLYNLIDNEKFSIQGKALPFLDSDAVLLGFKAENAGTFTISLGNFDGLFSEGDVIIYLKDNQTNTIHNLMQNPYVFESNLGVYDSRFEIVYQSTLGVKNLDLNNNVLIYKDNKSIVVKSNDEVQKIKIYDLLGRLIYSNYNVDETEYRIESDSFSSQILVVSVEIKNTIISSKIIN